MTENKIVVKDLNKSFGSNHVLQGINLEIKRGESFVIIGGSGSGKSVLLKNIIGLITPDSGKIFIDGEDVTHLDGSDRNHIMAKFGVLFQGGALFDSLPVWENITFGLLQLNRTTRRKAFALAVEKLNMVGLGKNVATLFPSELSGGMQKRVALARAIAMEPEIIFFDEPTSGLDPITADVINDLIISCSQQIGATTLTISHDMASVRRIANHVAMIYEGKFIWEGTINEMNTADNEYLYQFVHGKSDGPIKMKIQDHV